MILNKINWLRLHHTNGWVSVCKHISMHLFAVCAHDQRLFYFWVRIWRCFMLTNIRDLFYIKAPKHHQFTAYCTRLLDRINHIPTVCLACSQSAAKRHSTGMLYSLLLHFIIHNWLDWISRERNIKVSTCSMRGWSIICSISVCSVQKGFLLKKSIHCICPSIHA